MSGPKRPMPRLFLIRHGETEWSLNGKHTGKSDIPLTERGVDEIKEKAPKFVGSGKLIDPSNICHIFVSPRQRAQKTFQLLFEGVSTSDIPPTTTTEDVAEWDYGDYEGLKPAEIKERRPDWIIWRDGCPGGESVEHMTARIDGIIAKVHEKHRQFLEEGIGKQDIIIVAHGHFSRCFIARWVEFDLCLGTHFNMQPGGVALLTYQHNSLKEPSLTGLNLYAY